MKHQLKSTKGNFNSGAEAGEDKLINFFFIEVISYLEIKQIQST